MLCHHSAITISHKQVQKQNQDAVLFIPTKGSAPPGQLPGAFLDKACNVCSRADCYFQQCTLVEVCMASGGEGLLCNGEWKGSD
jgi:hypothetical protein